MTANHNEVEQRLWEAADQLRANSNLRASEYSAPVLGLIFLRYADQKFTYAERELTGKASGRRTIGKLNYQARGVMFLPQEARFQALLNLPGNQKLGASIDNAMRAVEAENEELKGVLPKTYSRFDNEILDSLLRTLNSLPMSIEGDAFGRIYEYFLGKFAMSEGQKGGEFFTPTSIVKLIVEIIEPYNGRILDPACGSGGMFVQSARFVENHKQSGEHPVLSIYGQEKARETIKLCRMNLAVHGLTGDIKEAITYYDDSHKSTDKFDFVMANPPFNVDGVTKSRLSEDTRYPFGMVAVDNANYLWMQIFFSALNERGRAGFVMANSAADARGSELEIRRKMIESGAVDVMLAVGSNFFYTVTLPCMLWFFDKGKVATKRKDKVLFIDARHLYRQIDRAHREFKSGCVHKLDLQARFPELEAIPNLLVESPIDADFWDWNEALQAEIEVERLIAPVVARLASEAKKLVESIYNSERYRKRGEALVAEEPLATSSAMIALVRSSTLAALRSGNGAKDVEDNAPAALDLESETIVRAVKRDFAKFRREAAERVAASAEERAKWLAVQAEGYNRQSERFMRELLAAHELLFDCERATLPLDDARMGESFDKIYRQDLAHAVALWRSTRGTNHIKILRDIVRSFRGEEGAGEYEDKLGLCKVASLAEIEANGWSLNPGRYVGVAERAADDFDFKVRLEELNEELETLNVEARGLEERIAENVRLLLEPEQETNAEDTAASMKADSFTGGPPHFTRDELHERG